MLAPDNRGSKVIVKNWTDVVIPIYNWTEYCDIYSKILGNLCQYYGDEPALYNTGNIFYFCLNWKKWQAEQTMMAENMLK